MKAITKAITIRKLPSKLVRIIEQRARRKGMSISKTIVNLLEETTGIQETKRGKTRYHDLDSLAGKWSRQEAELFKNGLNVQRKIDPHLWQ